MINKLPKLTTKGLPGFTLGTWVNVKRTNLPGANPNAWQVPTTGAIDEVRLYSIVLLIGDIN